MKQIAWLFKWLLKAAIFFTLFAFALNNQGDTTVHFFFDYRWTAPMVLVVLGAGRVTGRKSITASPAIAPACGEQVASQTAGDVDARP